MSIKIMSVAFPFAPVKDCTAGGAEQIVLTLDKAIVNAGLQSIVLAREDSEVYGHLIKLKFRSVKCTIEEKREYYEYIKTLIQHIADEYNIDIVHFHGIDCCNYIPDIKVKKIVTLHMSPQYYDLDLLQKNNATICFVSQYQRSLYSKEINNSKIIPNGTTINKLKTGENRTSYTLLMGRICPEKGFHIGIDASLMAGFPVMLAGEVYPYSTHVHYYNSVIVPRLNKDNCRFIGNAGSAKKDMLMLTSRCLIVPSLIDETFCLVAIEALARGTPVIAFDKGALNEIVINGVNGYLVHTFEEMKHAVAIVGNIKSDSCKESIEGKYEEYMMINRYLNLYISSIK
jgi:glycosyltransferase involved in cell wall biosynthesis